MSDNSREAFNRLHLANKRADAMRTERDAAVALVALLRAERNAVAEAASNGE